MIKLSDVKVRPQYRTRVRHHLVVLEYAWAHGPAAAGRHYRISARTIRRWRKRWRAAGVEGRCRRIRGTARAGYRPPPWSRSAMPARSSAMGPLGRACGCSASMGSGWPWERFNVSSGTWDYPVCGERASGNRAK